jgi:hypothetical protein
MILHDKSIPKYRLHVDESSEVDLRLQQDPRQEHILIPGLAALPYTSAMRSPHAKWFFQAEKSCRA